ncbi:ROK family protein [Sinomonas atrocyanea]|uniref:ROK family protein n=1 Tax=Sinomonas atrocyanea TaxID=37927 RepID=UPI001664F56B|nr:ROK family protein [Sinomonas atrocyanea]GGG70899.1 transcriptional regulator [Sinomonas atrocyanea]
MRKGPAAGPHVVRLANAEAVLRRLREAPEAGLTATELVDATGLSRATVIAVGDDLVRRGWAIGLDPERAEAGRGRPPRTFAFRADAGVVLGLDMGAGKTTTLEADLRGRTLGSASGAFPGAGAAGRVDTVSATALAALAAAGTRPGRVLAAAAGVAAPVDRDGRIATPRDFWEQFDVGLAEGLRARHGWPVILENDANLAALAEQWRGAAQGVDDVAVVLAGERLGAGLLESGRLLRGRHGGAGELSFLRLVEGAAGPHGIGQLARAWGAEAAAGGLAGLAPAEVTAEAVFEAARDGDPGALGVLARLAEHMSRVVAVLGTLLNPELVVLGGAVAGAAAALLPGIRQELPRLTDTPPRVEVSALGGDAVALGAVRRALDDVADRALAIELP